MLRRVARDQVRLGMYVQGIEGPWLSHPFWKRRFLLTDPADVDAVRASAIEAVVIDDERGIGPPPAAAVAPRTGMPVAPAADTASQPSSPPRKAKRKPRIAPCSASAEVERASQVIGQAKRAVAHMFGEVRLGNAVAFAEYQELVEEIATSVARNASALISLARLKTSDEYTYMHSVAVCALMINLARQLGLDEAAVREAGLAGLLHDVGKMMTPESVLNKPGSLTEAEFATMKAHPERGHALLVESGGVPASALDVCLHHHERVDGSGYPHGLAGDDIRLFARMGAVCDVYDAITSNRPYKAAWEPADALAAMFRWEGHFDDAVLAAFIRSVGIYPVGTLVRLRSRRLGVIADQHAEDLTKPIVRAFYAIDTRESLPVRDVDLLLDPGLDRIVAREQPAAWDLDPWEARWPHLIGLSPGTKA